MNETKRTEGALSPATGYPSEKYWDALARVLNERSEQAKADRATNDKMVWHQTEYPDLAEVARLSREQAMKCRALAEALDAIAQQAETDNEVAERRP